MSIRIRTISLFFAVGLIACGGNYSTEIKKDIIGIWESNDKSLTLEFTADGKVNSVIKQDGFTNESSSDLIFMDESNILGVWEFNLQLWNVQIRGNKMNLTSANGDKLKLSKVSD